MVYNKSLYFVVAGMLVFVGSASIKGNRGKTVSQNRMPAYETFTKKCPQEKLTHRTQTKLSGFYVQRNWQTAQMTNTVAAYEAFLQEYPQGSIRARGTQTDKRIGLENSEDTTNTTAAYEAFLQEHPAGTFTQEAREQVVDKTIEQIEVSGPGTRLTLSFFRPEKGEATGTLKLASTSMENQYEFDVLIYVDEQRATVHNFFGTLTTKSGTLDYGEFYRLQFPTGHKSVFVFKGNIRLGTSIFVGQSDDPLYFVLLEQHGLVYVCGTGNVVLPNGEEVPLPQSSAQKTTHSREPQTPTPTPTSVLTPTQGNTQYAILSSKIHVPGFDGMANVRVERDFENWPELLKLLDANSKIDWEKQRIISHLIFLQPNGEIKLSSGATLRGCPADSSELKFEFLGKMWPTIRGVYTDRCLLVLERSEVDPARGLDGFTYVFKAEEGDLVYVSGKGRVEILFDNKTLYEYYFANQ